MTQIVRPGRRISERLLEAAFDWLEESSVLVADARANAQRADFERKVVWSEIFKEVNGSVAQKEAQVMTHPRYKAAYEKYIVADAHWVMMQDQKNKAQVIIDCWRSEEASQRFIDKVTS